MKIVADDLRGPEIAALLRDHVDDMAVASPTNCINTLGIDLLRSPEITLWSAWDGSELLGCGALKELGGDLGEIKSMRTAESHLGKGVATKILQHIVKVAKQRGYRSLYLETGSAPAFQPAHSLYVKAGFSYCGPFADYSEDPFSRFMVLAI